MKVVSSISNLGGFTIISGKGRYIGEKKADIINAVFYKYTLIILVI